MKDKSDQATDLTGFRDLGVLGKGLDSWGFPWKAL